MHHVYLPDNHLDWWTAAQPPTSPVTALQQERYRALLREFHATIATVVGDDVEPDDRIDPFNLIADTGIEGGAGDEARFELYPMRRISWSAAAASANQPSPEFRVRHAVVNGSAPRFVNERFARDDGANRRRLIVTDDRNSIWLDFVVPQRAVGLQVGFAGGEDRGLDRNSFRLEAWRGDGSLVGATTGDDLTAADWEPRRVELLALRDDRGEIRTVRFSCTDPGFNAAEFLFLYRVWHEALPAAVVRQGTVTNFGLAVFRGHQHRDHPDLPPRPPAGVADSTASTVETVATPEMAGGMFSHDTVELALPFGCDRAVVILRGFKVIPGAQRANYRAPQPQEFSRLGVRIEETVRASANDRRISFRIRGEYKWGEEGHEHTFGLRAAYWTVLAWHSGRAELFRTSAIANSNQHRRKSGNSFDSTHLRPAADPAAVAAAGPEAVYGQLFGGLDAYSLTLPRPVVPEIYSFAIGSYGSEFPPAEFFEDEAAPPWDFIIAGLATGFSLGVAGIIGLAKLIRAASTLAPIIPLAGPLVYSADGRLIGWSFVTNLYDTLDRDERAWTSVSGTVLSGRSLSSLVLGTSVGADGAERPTVRVISLNTGAFPRDQPNYQAAFNVGMLDVLLRADQAVAVMGTFDFMPEDKVRELDVEVRAAHFDGERLLVALGSGIDVEPAIRDTFEEPDVAVTGDSGIGPDSFRTAFALPHVAGVTRTVPPTRVVLASGHAEFDWIDGTRDDLPRAAGYLRNDGNLPIGVRALRVEGASAQAFYLRLAHRGTVKFLDRFIADLPLTLFPGETIELHGSFSSAAVPPPSRPGGIARARLIFAFADPHPDVEIQAFAVKSRGRASGAIFPPRYDFGRVRTPTGPQVIGGTPSGSGGRTVGTPPPAHAVSRVFAVQNPSPTPLVVRSMTITPGGAGLSFRMVRHPSAGNLGGLRAVPPALFVCEPASDADFLLTWAPRRLGPMAARLTVETNGGPLVMEIVGEAIPEA